MSSTNRIFFPGSPWREGHAIERLRWTGRIEEDGLYFDLDLESARYCAECDFDEDDDEDEDEDAEDAWKSPNVWTNYDHCSLSSTQWGNTGILVANEEDPLDWATLADWVFEADMQTAVEGDEPHAFHIYLLGHDTVLRHRIHFSEPHGGKHRLRWKARIALTYAGQQDLKHRLEVDAEVAFEGFRPAKGIESPHTLLERFTFGKTRYTEREGVYLPE